MSAICDAHKKKVGVEQLYNPGEDRKSVSWRSNQLERRCWNEEHVPGWAAQENGKKRCYGYKEWGSICCSSVRSPTPSHSKTFSNPFEPFQIKWGMYFSKELCRSSLLCRCYDSACICVGIVVHGYTIFTNPSARAGYDTRSIFKQRLTGLNSEFSFS